VQAIISGEIQRRESVHPSLQWLGVMENDLHVGNTSSNFWVDIVQTYLEVRVAQN
jgi:hypothetical protein